jgi:hypothetical protein
VGWQRVIAGSAHPHGLRGGDEAGRLRGAHQGVVRELGACQARCMSITTRSRYHAPTVRLRHTHHRDIINSTACSACEQPLGQPCMLNYVERLATDTIHTCRLPAWLRA